MGCRLFFGLKSMGNASLATMAMIIIMLPLFLLALYERDGRPLEVIVYQFIQAKFIRPKVRPYQTDCYYSALLRQYEVYEEVDKIVCKEKGIGGCKNARKSDVKRTEADPGRD